MKKIIFGLMVCFLCKVHAYKYEVAVATIFKNEAPYFKEWIEYHRMMGVEHFWLYNNKSTDNFEEVLKPYIDEGIVELIDWPSSQGAFMGRQCQAYVDAINKSTGVVKWLALIDVDEFLVPMMDSNLSDCLKRFEGANAIYANWRMFGTSRKHLRSGDPILFELFECSKKTHSSNAVGKTIIRPEFANTKYFWHPHFCQLKSGDYRHGDGKKITFSNTQNEVWDLRTDGKNHDKYIRINHYYFRDENFYKNVRIARVLYCKGPIELLKEHYHLYSMDRDYRIMKLVKHNYPDMYRKFWKK